jgi:hypothetical protein
MKVRAAWWRGRRLANQSRRADWCCDENGETHASDIPG